MWKSSLPKVLSLNSVLTCTSYVLTPNTHPQTFRTVWTSWPHDTMPLHGSFTSFGLCARYTSCLKRASTSFTIRKATQSHSTVTRAFSWTWGTTRRGVRMTFFHLRKSIHFISYVYSRWSRYTDWPAIKGIYLLVRVAQMDASFYPHFLLSTGSSPLRTRSHTTWYIPTTRSTSFIFRPYARHMSHPLPDCCWIRLLWSTIRCRSIYSYTHCTVYRFNAFTCILISTSDKFIHVPRTRTWKVIKWHALDFVSFRVILVKIVIPIFATHANQNGACLEVEANRMPGIPG